MNSNYLQSCSADSIQKAQMRVPFTKSPNGSFPGDQDGNSEEIKTSTDKCRRFCIGNDTSAYQELREFRLPSVQSVKRNVKTSMKKLRCQARARFGSSGTITYDDFTADLYGCDCDDELPLLTGSGGDESTN
jgi:hypothetical protein